MPITAPIPRTERRLMQKTIQKTHDKNYARRLLAMLIRWHHDIRKGISCSTLCADADYYSLPSILPVFPFTNDSAIPLLSGLRTMNPSELANVRVASAM